MIKKLFFKYFELVFWIAALIALAVCDPAQPSHFTLCPFKLLGITWCPGCGIGHAIAFLFHGDIAGSFNAHWLGLPALGIICWRIITLSVNVIRPRKLAFQ
ncbi:DUF2752 domain-containing protein [Mucilaginibacter calamicampi]|uniref:DUF2752 domain-containing protein n=1 Tax=Mucilaginibacter calamicampi TaxID=1302352 RepID=A0ABW2Z1B8_9SPHI